MGAFEVIGFRLDLVVLSVVAISLLTIGAAVTVLACTKWRDKRFDMMHGAGGAGIVSLVLGGAAGVTFLIMLAPFQSQYHHWYSTSGEVASVTNVFEGGSGEVSPGYVVELDSVEQPLMFGDPRILSKQGQEVNVSCSLEWVPVGADRLNCWIAN